MQSASLGGGACPAVTSLATSLYPIQPPNDLAVIVVRVRSVSLRAPYTSRSLAGWSRRRPCG